MYVERGREAHHARRHHGQLPQYYWMDYMIPFIEVGEP